MNRLIKLFIISLFVGCSGENPAPTKDEIAGTWVGSDGAIIELNKDGTFTGKLLPADILIKIPEYEGTQFDGSGTWTIKNKSKSYDQLPWEVYLDYAKTSVNYNGASSLLISGDNFLENQAPWKYMFSWTEEEGGERYKFIKKTE